MEVSAPLNTIGATDEVAIEQGKQPGRPPEPGHAGEGAGGRPHAVTGLAALVRACRPRQWVKNLLVLAAPGAAGMLVHPQVAAEVAGAFVSFCLLSSAGYLVNDVRDRREDARHPRRRRRPIASGEVSVAVALGAAFALTVLGLGLGFAVRPLLGMTGAGYLAITVSYSLWLRRVAIADIAIVAAGFVLRALAGGAATGIPVSRWFVMVTSFGALFLVAGKRYAEFRNRGEDAGTRSTLTAYSEDYLRFVMILAASVTTVAYCLWAFQGHGNDGISWYEITVAPFVLWLLRYGLLLHEGHGEAPEDVLLHDRFLMSMSGAWMGVFACAVYVGT